MTNDPMISGGSRAVPRNDLLRGVYSWMMLGLLISAATAFLVAHSPALEQALFGNLYTIWFLVAIELGLVVVISAAINRISVPMARVLFLLFSFVDGLTLAVIFLAYTEASIATTFFIAALTFGVMSLYGYFTDSDLSSIGTFLFMALVGLVIAIIVNFFLASPTFDWIISIVGIFVFVGLTAYDTQKIRQLGEEPGIEEGERAARLAILGALSLYLDLINLFIMMLQFTGDRR